VHVLPNIYTNYDRNMADSKNIELNVDRQGDAPGRYTQRLDDMNKTLGSDRKALAKLTAVVAFGFVAIFGCMIGAIAMMKDMHMNNSLMVNSEGHAVATAGYMEQVEVAAMTKDRKLQGLVDTFTFSGKTTEGRTLDIHLGVSSTTYEECDESMKCGEGNQLITYKTSEGIVQTDGITLAFYDTSEYLNYQLDRIEMVTEDVEDTGRKLKILPMIAIRVVVALAKSPGVRSAVGKAASAAGVPSAADMAAAILSM